MDETYDVKEQGKLEVTKPAVTETVAIEDVMQKITELQDRISVVRQSQQVANDRADKQVAEYTDEIAPLQARVDAYNSLATKLPPIVDVPPDPSPPEII